MDSTSIDTPDPWLWVGDISKGTVKRRSPRNIGWSRDLFGGPGALADRERRLEDHLSEQVEGPAAEALREFLARSIGAVKEIPPALSRYIAWLAARSLSMKELYETWIAELGPQDDAELVEAPPPQLAAITPAPDRLHTMEHPEHGVRHDVRDDEIEALRLSGWRLRLSPQDFLEMVHIQAFYFEERFFPRLAWKVLDAPSDSVFITSDRPAVWGADGMWEVPPSALRSRGAEFLVPVSRSRALYGVNPQREHVPAISPSEVNRVIAVSARSWIAGPTQEIVQYALLERTILHSLL